MKKLIYISVLLFVKNMAFSQTIDFPKKFIGNWKGESKQWNGRFMDWPMQLQIIPADSADKYYLRIMEGDGIFENRALHILKPANKYPGHWIVNIKDGVVLDLYAHANAVHIAYTMDSTMYLYNYRIEADKIFMESFGYSLKSTNRSGLGTREIPFFDTYMIGGYSTAVLERQK